MPPSTETTVEAVGNSIILTLTGFALLGGGGFFLYREQATPPSHTSHILFFGCIALFGALVLLKDRGLKLFQTIVVTVAPYVPVIGGRRATDIPAPIELPPPGPPTLPPAA